MYKTAFQSTLTLPSRIMFSLSSLKRKGKEPLKKPWLEAPFSHHMESKKQLDNSKKSKTFRATADPQTGIPKKKPKNREAVKNAGF